MISIKADTPIETALDPRVMQQVRQQIIHALLDQEVEQAFQLQEEGTPLPRGLLEYHNSFHRD